MAQASSKFDSPPRDIVPQPAIVGGLTPRFHAANTAELYYESTQYEGLASWESELPLKRRKPREVIPLYRTAIDTLHSFIWGGARFPRVTIAATRSDDSDDDDEIGPRLWEDDASALTTFVQEMMRSARLDRAVGEYSRKALVTTSCAVFLSVQGGKLCYYVEDGKHCTPTWCKDNPRQLESIDICYQFERQEPLANGQQSRAVKYWFRRIIDEQNDTVYNIVPVTGAMPVWTVDASKSTSHGLGFCPVVWVRTLPISSDAVDGCPVVDPALYKLLDRVNYVYSLRGRSVEYNLDPQWVRKNVAPAKRALLQKSTQKMWDIEDEDEKRPADIKLIEADGSGSATASELLNDLRKRFTEAVRIVIADPDAAAGRNISGVVLEYLHAPMIALASDLRKDLGDDALGDVINLALRMICTIKARGEDVFVQGVSKAVKIMMTAQLGGPWLEFPVRLQWGRFFSPSGEEISTMVQATAAAKAAGLISNTKATQAIADMFSIADVGAELEAIDDDKQQAQQDAIENAQAMAKTMPQMDADPSPVGKQQQPKAKSKKAQRVGSPKP
jgi:hypothetical protein